MVECGNEGWDEEDEPGSSSSPLVTVSVTVSVARARRQALTAGQCAVASAESKNGLLGMTCRACLVKSEKDSGCVSVFNRL
jgi:hypothetical protein